MLPFSLTFCSKNHSTFFWCGVILVFCCVFLHLFFIFIFNNAYFSKNDLAVMN